MSNSSKPSLRIDWFDGTLIEHNPNAAGTSQFADEDQPEHDEAAKSQHTERKPIGFKRLLDISLLNPPILTLEVAHRPGFWMLLETELKGDFIVLIVKVLANIYKTLDTREKSRIANLLKNKFEKSSFLDNLEKFLETLPKVRVVEKRMNSQLWNDVESFYSNVLSLYEGIIAYDPSNLDAIIKIKKLVDVTETSITGVREEHTERFSDELFLRIHKLQILNISDKSLDKDEAIISGKPIEDPDNFRSLSVYPTLDDLLGKKQTMLKPNIINGAYSSVEHYLDLQFKLLREDYFGPLREGICKYTANPSKRRYENIRVCPKVRIIRTYVCNNKVGYLVDLAWKERLNHTFIDSKKYAYNKQLMFGSLLLFTNNNFETILCATVLDSGLALLTEGYIAVTFETPVSNKIFDDPYLMVESEVFFEPYHRVLRVLQSFKEDLPMRRYIVDVQSETKHPAYLSQETIYSILDSRNSEELPFPVLDTKSWPESKCFGLDDSQMEAYKLALTREFAVIQGPPGTGKTYIGVKIASTILKNFSLEGTPMLIICYTNHALDKFLEGILKVTNNIVRLGSQSKSKAIESYTLHNLRSKVKCKYSYLYGSKRAELEKIFKEMTELQSEIDKCEKEIVCYKHWKSHLKPEGQLYELKNSQEDPVLGWLFDDFNVANDSEEELEDWEKQFDEVNIDSKIETCFSEQLALKEIDSLNSSIKYVKDVTDDPYEIQKMAHKLEEQILKVKTRLSNFKKYISLNQNVNIQEESKKKVTDIYKLGTEQRWRLYHRSVGKVKGELMKIMNDLLEQHKTCTRELGEVATLIDVEVMKTVRVVGATTATAARRHDLMRQLLSPIVIVEEAAEVLEGHIVASLTHHCQQLILIGDHKQLRPTAAHYKLAKDYNLEVSLFERMIRNGIHSRTLLTQRRMRPNFVELLVPVIYERLDSHPNMKNYCDVRGMKHNLYFCTHSATEDSEGLEDSWSHKNTHEAKWCVSLASYLRLMNYNTDEITVLATYAGQVNLIKELSKKYTQLQDVKITAVDSYQGEENRIVILSLVRSNRDGNIGFLAAANRICVALSRAKEGFYIFGNMNVLKAASTIWKSIESKLRSQTAIGDVMTLHCNIHKETVQVSNPEDFDLSVSYPCLNTCKK